jgi:hypothetical protein
LDFGAHFLSTATITTTTTALSFSGIASYCASSKILFDANYLYLTAKSFQKVSKLLFEKWNDQMGQVISKGMKNPFMETHQA